MEKLKNQCGITLIALIITIVILIILATITINYAFGDRGLIDQAQTAKNMAETAAEDEQEKRNNLSQHFSNMIGSQEEPEATYNISGTIKFVVSPEIEGRNADIYLYKSTDVTSTDKAEQESATPVKQISTGGNNNFLIEDVEPGIYTLVAKRISGTDAFAFNVVVNDKNVVIDTTLEIYMGDINLDNKVDQTDFSELAEKYLDTIGGDYVYDEKDDINFDGVFNQADVTAAQGNINKTSFTINL